MIKELFLFLATSSLVLTTPQKVKNDISIRGKVIETNGCKAGTLPTTIDLSICSDEEIRDYYSSLNSLSSDKLSGITALQYLKPILYEMNYFTYAQVSNIYAITDRDWKNSPNVSSGNYDAETKIVTNFSISAEANTNPYIKMLYADYSKIDKTKLRKDNGNANFDKEHVWCQSRGFKAPSGAQGPAGTDLHHLIAGDSQVNENVHNNIPYGFVKTESSKGNQTFTSGNRNGSILHTSTQDESTLVFEPIDSNKGDIARAIFYMMARYNNVSGKETISTYEPNLTIVNYATSNGAAVESKADKPVGMGIISDLLAWNKIDPVDEFEIYRNDLIYRNYQGNRNPFIDFPQWIDAIWGTANIDGTNYSSTPVGKINPASDSIHDAALNVSSSSLRIRLTEKATIKATTADKSAISWTVNDPSIVKISKSSTASEETNEIETLKVGTTKVVATATIDGITYSKEITVTVFEEKPVDFLPIIISVAAVIFIFIPIGIVVKKSKKKTKKKSSKTKKRY